MKLTEIPAGFQVRRDPDSKPDTDRSFQSDDRKTSDRDRVFKFITENHVETHSPRFFTMPSDVWALEHKMLAWRPDTMFIGVEWKSARFESGLWRIPGRRVYTERKETALGSFPVHHVISDGRTVATIGEVAFEVLLNFRREDVSPPDLAKKTARKSNQWWTNNFGRWTSFWIDFNGMLTPQRLRAFTAIPSRCERSAPRIPGVISYLKGRDFLGGEQRSEFVQRALEGRQPKPLRKTRIVDVWESVSENRATMENVAVILE